MLLYMGHTSWWGITQFELMYSMQRCHLLQYQMGYRDRVLIDLQNLDQEYSKD